MRQYQTPHYLVLDQGGHATRAILFDATGPVHYSEIPLTATHHANGHIEYNADELLTSFKRALDRLATQADLSQVTAASLATQRSNCVCWNKISGKALSPVISWQDRRGADWLTAFTDQAAPVQQRTGLFLSAHYGASKLHWCLHHLAAVQAALTEGTLAYGPMSAFITWHLTQQHTLACDPVNASRTLLWDLTSHDWSAEMLQLFGLPAAPLPPVVANQYEYGTLPGSLAHIPLTCITGDQAAALYAFGEPTLENVYITAGTGAFIQRPTATHRPTSTTLLNSIVLLNDRGAAYAMEGTVNGAGAALVQMAAELGLDNWISQLPRWLMKSHQPPLFLNGVSGLGTPYMRAGFHSRFIGPGDAVDQFIGVVESIIFLLHINLQQMDCLPTPIKKIILGGGLARNNGFCQRLADLSQLIVCRSPLHETTSTGLAWLLSDRARSTLDQSNTQIFMPQHNPALTDRFNRWQAAMTEALQQDD